MPPKYVNHCAFSVRGKILFCISRPVELGEASRLFKIKSLFASIVSKWNSIELRRVSLREASIERLRKSSAKSACRMARGSPKRNMIKRNKRGKKKCLYPNRHIYGPINSVFRHSRTFLQRNGTASDENYRSLDTSSLKYGRTLNARSVTSEKKKKKNLLRTYIATHFWLGYFHVNCPIARITHCQNIIRAIELSYFLIV